MMILSFEDKRLIKDVKITCSNCNAELSIGKNMTNDIKECTCGSKIILAKITEVTLQYNYKV